METTTQENLLQMMLEGTTHDTTPTVTDNEWQQAYNDFCFSIENMASGSSFIPVMRSLEHQRIELAVLHNRLDTESPAYTYCDKALEMTCCELRMLDLRLHYPGIVKSEDRAKSLPPLYLNPNYHLTDLVELIIALYEVGIFQTEGGQRSHLVSIVRLFEIAFNVSLSNFDVLRTAAINRKIHLTRFLDQLRNALIEVSQR